VYGKIKVDAVSLEHSVMIRLYGPKVWFWVD